VFIGGLAACSPAPAFDLIVRGGTVYDGTGDAAGVRRADVGIKGDRIAAIGNLSGQSTRDAIDATGKVVAPGFIDVLGRSGVTLLADGIGESHLRQGITTEILGDHSPAFWMAATADATALRVLGVTFDWGGPGGYFAKLDARGTAINIGTLLPLSAAIANPAAIDAGMAAGAFGVVDDIGRDGPDLDEAAALASRRGGIVMCDAENPAVTTDAALLALAAKAGRLIVELSRVPEESLSGWIQRITQGNQRQTPVYGVVTLYGAAAGGDRVVAGALRYGSVLVGTGSAATSSRSASPDASPAAFGTYSRLLGQMVRDAHVFDLREAVRRATSAPAAAFQIEGRGIVRENSFADIVVIDPATIADRATGDNPRQYSAGVDYVIVNGVVVLTPRGLTGSRPGHAVLHRAGSR